MSVEVTLHSNHHSLTPSKQRSRIHALTGEYLRYVRSTSFFGGCKTGAFRHANQHGSNALFPEGN